MKRLEQGRSTRQLNLNQHIGAAGDAPTLVGKVERSAGKEGGAILPKATKNSCSAVARGSICPEMDGIRAMQEQLPREAKLLLSDSSYAMLFQFLAGLVYSELCLKNTLSPA
mgnify:CR=1 FL=1